MGRQITGRRGVIDEEFSFLQNTKRTPAAGRHSRGVSETAVLAKAAVGI